MDAVTLDHLIAELTSVLAGRYLGRPRALGSHAIGLDLSGVPAAVLLLDAERANPVLTVVERDQARSWVAEHPSPAARTRHGLLLIRKHLAGARVTRTERIAGERTVLLETTRGLLALRFSGSSPALTLAVDGVALATLGEGPPAWPAPVPEPEREWDRLEPTRFAEIVAQRIAAGRSLASAVLGACPGLGPWLARRLDGSAESFADLRDRLRSPQPTLFATGAADTLSDADLAIKDSVGLAPCRWPPAAPMASPCGSWREAANAVYALRRRGLRFAERQRENLAEARREIRRLTTLLAHLARDQDGLTGLDLRRQGEALLASSSSAPTGAAVVDVPDPYCPETRLRIAIDPALSLPANADRLFAKARRIERARIQIEARRKAARAALGQARDRERCALDARNLGDLQPLRAAAREESDASTGPRHYLTSNGRSILVGRGARENHHLAFTVARPDDLWLHAREVAGAHVILLDRDGRTSADDLREAAEVAAFFSQAHGEARVDVHLARRKHVRPAGGGPGRVRIAHAETLRVAPRDPEGRLRRR